jgi:hypothetical protein
MLLVAVRDGDHGILGKVGRGRGCMRSFLRRLLIERNGKRRGRDGC